MRLPELNNTLTITDGKINDINTIKSKMEFQLNAMKARTYVTNNVITFSALKFNLPSGSQMDRKDSLRIIKEGRIDISKESHSLKIRWSVKLNHLCFLAFCFSIVAGLAMSLYLSTELIISVSFGIIFFLIFVIIGIQFIKHKLSDLIYSCVYRNYY